MGLQIPEQDTFNTVARHLLCQGRRSPDHHDPRGLRSAAGCLISDIAYYSMMDGETIPMRSNGELSPAVECIERQGHNLTLVYALQRIHDFYEPHAWPSKLAVLALALGLERTVLHEFGNYRPCHRRD